MYRPEVGEICEVLYNTDGTVYCKAKIIGMDDDCFVFKFLSGERLYEFESCDNHVDCVGNEKFRPIKSKRDEEIEELTGIIEDVCKMIWCKKGMAKSIHDAGYRKQIPYSDFVALIENYLYDVLGYSENNAQFQATELAAKLNRTPDEE